jgi:PAS domain S-box-containing protein
MTMSLQKDKRVRLDTSGLPYGEGALRREVERLALLLEVASDLIRASEPGELGRMTFERVKSAFGAVVCTNYRFDPATQRLRLVFVHGVPPERLEDARSLELGQEYCGTTAGILEPLVADKQRIVCDPNAGLVRELRATAYACYPLKASDGRLLGTFAVASATREGFTDDDVVWLGTITNFLAQAWERFEAEEALRVSKDRLQLALDAAQLGWWQYDPLSDAILGDARLKEIFDFAADKTPVEEIMKRVHPDDAARVRAWHEATLDPADPRPYAQEFRIQRRDGEFRWVEAHRLAYFEGNGREPRLVSSIGTVQDITERKQHEEQEHLLMREVSHRAKNMLSVVDSIAHLTATQNPEDFVERFSERVQALSANQDLLIRNDWKGVDVEDLVHTQLAHFADLVSTRIAIHGPRLRLNPASAQAIGLALHELGTNAGKYGALSTDTGRVDIGWGTDGDTFTMSWTERDGPHVSAPERRGFGTIVMEAMAERSVGGKVNLGYAPTGVTWRLICPATNALEPWEREQISGTSENRTDGATGKVEVRTRPEARG